MKETRFLVSVCLCFVGSQCFGDLIGAGCPAAMAVDAFKGPDHIIDFHADDDP